MIISSFIEVLLDKSVMLPQILPADMHLHVTEELI